MSILDNFPKSRIELSDEYAKIYQQHYFQNRNGKYRTTSISQRLEAWMHLQVAADLHTNGMGVSGEADFHLSNYISTLEIGAGTLNQLDYEPQVGRYDIVEPFTQLYEQAQLRNRVHQSYLDISEIPVDQQYDRITSIATFEHIVDLPIVVAEAAKRLTEHGNLRVAIPNEGTCLWKLGTMITGMEFQRRYGLDYQQLMRFEHVNCAHEIEEVLQYFFRNCKCRVFGINKRLAFYRFYECRNVNHGRVSEFLNNRSTQRKQVSQHVA